VGLICGPLSPIAGGWGGSAPTLATLAALFCLTALPAFADEIDDCEQLGTTQLSNEANSPRVFTIDREALNFDKAETKVGSEFVSSVLHGPAKLNINSGAADPVRFICLHGGTGNGALFFWLLPN
jgi:hypothetical protein